MKIVMFMILFAAVVFQAGAESLSELDTKGFQDKSALQSSGAKNPFVPQKASLQDLMVEDLHLGGIIYNQDEAYALVSGYVIKEGDEIAGYKVKAIERDHIVLRQLDQVRILQLE